jgi:urease gamma subunit
MNRRGKRVVRLNESEMVNLIERIVKEVKREERRDRISESRRRKTSTRRRR